VEKERVTSILKRGKDFLLIEEKPSPKSVEERRVGEKSEFSGNLILVHEVAQRKGWRFCSGGIRTTSLQGGGRNREIGRKGRGKGK